MSSSSSSSSSSGPYGVEIITWNPRVGDAGDDRYRWNPRYPLLAGEDLRQGVSADGIDPPAIRPCVIDVNNNWGLNQIISEINRRLQIWVSIGSLGDDPQQRRTNGEWIEALSHAYAPERWILPSGGSTFRRGLGPAGGGSPLHVDWEAIGGLAYKVSTEGGNWLERSDARAVVASLINALKEEIWQIEATEGIRPHFAFTRPVRGAAPTYPVLTGTSADDLNLEQEYFEMRKALATDHVRLYCWQQDSISYGWNSANYGKSVYQAGTYPAPHPPPPWILRDPWRPGGNEGMHLPGSFGRYIGQKVRTLSPSPGVAANNYEASAYRAQVGFQLPCLPGIPSAAVAKILYSHDKYLIEGANAFFGDANTTGTPSGNIIVARHPAYAVRAAHLVTDRRVTFPPFYAVGDYPLYAVAKSWQEGRENSTKIGEFSTSVIPQGTRAFVEVTLDGPEYFWSCEDVMLSFLVENDWNGVWPAGVSPLPAGYNDWSEAEWYAAWYGLNGELSGDGTFEVAWDGMAYDLSPVSPSFRTSGLERSCLKLYFDEIGSSSSSCDPYQEHPRVGGSSSSAR